MVFVTIIFVIFALIFWVVGAYFATQAVYNTTLSDTLFAIPLLPILFKSHKENYTNALVLSAVAYGLSISAIIGLFTI